MEANEKLVMAQFICCLCVGGEGKLSKSEGAREASIRIGKGKSDTRGARELALVYQIKRVFVWVCLRRDLSSQAA